MGSRSSEMLLKGLLNQSQNSCKVPTYLKTWMEHKLSSRTALINLAAVTISGPSKANVILLLKRHARSNSKLTTYPVVNSQFLKLSEPQCDKVSVVHLLPTEHIK